MSLVPLPSEHPVNGILTTYFEEEKHKRRLGSAEADLLEEVVAGCKEYFEKCVGRILLYRFERQQYHEVRKLWEEGKGEWEGKNAGDVYGAEHLCRLFGTSILPAKSKSKEYLTNTAPTQSPSPNSSPKRTWTTNPSANSAMKWPNSRSGSARTRTAFSRLSMRRRVRSMWRRVRGLIRWVLGSGYLCRMYNVFIQLGTQSHAASLSQAAYGIF